MPSSSQHRAIAAHRQRLADRGVARFEVRGLEGDKQLIRSIAQRLAAGDATAGELRSELARRIGSASEPRTGGVLAALRRSPLVGAELDLTRENSPGRADLL